MVSPDRTSACTRSANGQGLFCSPKRSREHIAQTFGNALALTGMFRDVSSDNGSTSAAILSGRTTRRASNARRCSTCFAVMGRGGCFRPRTSRTAGRGLDGALRVRGFGGANGRGCPSASSRQIRARGAKSTISEHGVCKTGLFFRMPRVLVNPSLHFVATRRRRVFGCPRTR